MVFDKKWFEKHQSKLLWLVNNKWGRKILNVKDAPKNASSKRIIKIVPNAVFWKTKKKDQFVAEFRSTNEFAIRLRKAFYPLWYLAHTWDTLVAEPFFPKLDLDFNTLEVNPDTGGSGNFDVSNEPVFATARNQATSDTNSVAWNCRASFSAGNYFISRMGLPYDTSALTAAATITPDVNTHSVYFTSNSSSDADSLRLITYSPASSTARANGDYDSFATTAQATGDQLISGITTDSYNALTLNTTGEGNISLTGFSNFAFRSVRDINDSAPTGLNQPAANGASDGNPPKLVITFTRPGGLIHNQMI